MRERVAVTGEGVGLAARIARFDVGERGLGHERTEPDVVRLLLEEHQLFLGDTQLGADALESLAHVDEATLQDRP